MRHHIKLQLRIFIFSSELRISGPNFNSNSKFERWRNFDFPLCDFMITGSCCCRLVLYSLLYDWTLYTQLCHKFRQIQQNTLQLHQMLMKQLLFAIRSSKFLPLCICLVVGWQSLKAAALDTHIKLKHTLINFQQLFPFFLKFATTPSSCFALPALQGTSIYFWTKEATHFLNMQTTLIDSSTYSLDYLCTGAEMVHPVFSFLNTWTRHHNVNKTQTNSDLFSMRSDI